jgi:hypothetical protein
MNKIKEALIQIWVKLEMIYKSIMQLDNYKRALINIRQSIKKIEIFHQEVIVENIVKLVISLRKKKK